MATELETRRTAAGGARNSPAGLRVLSAAIVAAAILFGAWSAWLIYTLDQRQSRFVEQVRLKTDLAELRAGMQELQATSDPSGWMSLNRECLNRIAGLRTGAPESVGDPLRNAGSDLLEAARLFRQFASNSHQTPTSENAAVRVRRTVTPAVESVEKAYRAAGTLFERSSAGLETGWRAVQMQMLGAALLGFCAIFIPVMLRNRREGSALEAEPEPLAGQLFEAASDGILVVNETGAILAANPAAGRMFGVPVPELVGQPVESVVHGSGRHGRRSPTSFLQPPPVFDPVSWRPLTAVNRSGTEFPVDVVTSELPGEGARRYFLTIRDVTVRRKTEKALADDLAFNRLVLSEQHVALAVFDAAGKPVYFNRACQETLGYASQEVNERPFWETICPPEYRADVESSFQKAVRKNKPGELLWVVEDRRGSRRNLRWSVTSLPNELGQPAFVVAVCPASDASERLDPQAAQTEKMEAIGRLASGLAHDFNNIVTAITGYSDLVLDSLPPDDPLRPDVEEIVKAADRAASLTRQLMAFSKHQVLQPKVVNLNLVISNMTNMLQRLMGEAHPISTELADDLWAVKSDPNQLERVIVNLAVNGRDAMPQGGRLALRTANRRVERTTPMMEAGEYAVLEVSDSGVGMAPEIQTHIFEPFFSTKHSGHGTGLGLSTVYAVVNQCHGAIEVESAPGEGSTFRIFLPKAANSETVAEQEGGDVGEAAVGGSETVLVVEDEDEVRELLSRVLRNNGYKVLNAADAREARRHAQSVPAPIDLLVTDLVLPGECGRKLAASLQERWRDLRVLYVSGYPEAFGPDWTVSEARFLQKPFATSELLRRVRTLLDASKT